MFDSGERERQTGLWIILLCLFLRPAVDVIADEHPQTVSPNQAAPSDRTTAPLMSRLRIDVSGLSKSFIGSRAEAPPLPQVSRSPRPLRRVTLLGGDRFDAEFLTSSGNSAIFRLLTGQMIRVPFAAISALSNPPGEVDILEESFEADSAIASDPVVGELIDDTQAADGRRSLKLTSKSPQYRLPLPEPLDSGRLEFWFRLGVNDRSSRCGEWQLEWRHGQDEPASVVIRIEADQRMSVAVPKGINASSQSLRIDDGWHAFIVLITPERTRLIVDDALLASFTTSDSSIPAVRFPAPSVDSTNALWIDAIQSRRLLRDERQTEFRTAAADEDSVVLTSGDELFGQFLGITRSRVLMKSFGDDQSLAWNQLSRVTWKQPAHAVRQTILPVAGIVSQIEMQPFVDRPELAPARWTVTVLDNNLKSIVAQHPLVGELTIPWSAIRRVDSTYMGTMQLLDARTFHLGNSIRSDFQRHMPDGTELEIGFHLREIPRGRPYVSFEVVDLEAAGPTAPPGSPLLAELRSGRMITEGLLNDRKIGSINSLIRFKSPVQHPERVRIPIPNGILNVGENSFRIRQLPLKYPGKKFDDCEVANFRLEFDFTDDQ